MCGIIGVAGNINTKEENAFKFLLCIDTLRGPDSTGVLKVPKTYGDPKVLKQVGTPWHGLFKEPDFKTLTSSFSKVLLGHNRAATMGSITHEHSHPFQKGGIIGVHNGTLRGQHLLDDWWEFDVDSENIFYHLQKHGAEDTISNLMGAFALVWYDTESRELQFIRNKERPLKYAFSENGETIFWASESWMLEAAFNKYGIKHGQILDFKEMCWYRLPILNGCTYWQGGKQISESILGKFRTKQMKECLPAYGRNNHYYGYGFGEHGYGQRKSHIPIKDRRKHLPPVHRRDSSSANDPITYQDYKNCEGKYVFFRIMGAVLGSKDGSYIKGSSTDKVRFTKSGLTVRIFPADGDWDRLDVSGKLFRGKVKKAKKIDGGYLLIDRKSVQEAEENDNNFFRRTVERSGPGDKQDNLRDDSEYDDLPFDPNDHGSNFKDMIEVGPTGNTKHVTKEHFQRLVKGGCIICSDPIEAEDHDTLEWTNDDQPICYFCFQEWDPDDKSLPIVPTNEVFH